LGTASPGLARSRLHSKCLDQSIKSLQLKIAQIFVVERQALGYRFISRAMDHDTTRLSELFQALRQNHSVTGHRIVGHHDFPDRDAHSEYRAHLVSKLIDVGSIGDLKRQ